MTATPANRPGDRQPAEDQLPQPRDIALEQVTPEQAAALEEQSDPDGHPEDG